MASSEQLRAPELLLEIVQLREEADAVARSLLDGRCIVEALSLRVPTLQPAELGFLRAVAWLYVQYFEAGLVGVRFVSGLFDAFGLDVTRRLRDHVSRVSRLRTYLQHNLDPASQSDARTRVVCEEWFEHVCGSRVPGTETHWARGLAALLDEAAALFHALRDVVRRIESDEGRSTLIEQWLSRIRRHHPPACFDSIIAEAAADIGRPHLDIVKFRKRHYDRFAEALSLLDGEYDFRREGRLLVEQALLNDVTAVLPITGSDVIREFGIQPGPEVGRLLELATTLYRAQPCDSAELVSRLKEAVPAGRTG